MLLRILPGQLSYLDLSLSLSVNDRTCPVCLYYVCVWRRKRNKSKILQPYETSLYSSNGGKSYRSKDSNGLLEDGRESWEIDTSDVQ